MSQYRNEVHATIRAINCGEFATECYIRFQDEQAANEQLRLDLKDAMKLARIQNMKDNAA